MNQLGKTTTLVANIMEVNTIAAVGGGANLTLVAQQATAIGFALTPSHTAGGR